MRGLLGQPKPVSRSSEGFAINIDSKSETDGVCVIVDIFRILDFVFSKRLGS